MKKFAVLVFLICISCLTVSFAVDDVNSTLSTNDYHVTKISDASSTGKLVKSDSYVDDSDKTLVKNATKTSTNHTYVRPKAYVQLNASVMDDNSEAVNEGQVFFKINDEILKDANNTTYLADVKNGFAQLNYYVGLVPTADYNLTAVYNGSSNYNVSSSDSILTVCKNKTTMDIVINPESVVSGKKMNLTAVFTREDNVTVTGGKVAFKLNHITIKDKKGNPIYARLVDGKASIETSIPVGTSAKTYVISATYSGTTENEETRSKDYQFNVLKDDVNVILSQNNYTVEWGEVISVRGEILTSDNRTTRRYHNIAIKLNNNTKACFVSSLNNESTFNFNLETDNLTNDEYNLTIIIGENGAFNEKRIETKLFVIHNFDKFVKIQYLYQINDSHIILKIDNSTYEIKELIDKKHSNETLNGTLVVIENDKLKLRFNDTKKHNVSIDYYTDLYDLSNITLTSKDDLVLFVDEDYPGTGITWCFDDKKPYELVYGNVMYMGDYLISFSVRVVIDNKMLKVSYGDNKTHNISISKISWIGSEDNPESLKTTETKLLEFIGGRSN